MKRIFNPLLMILLLSSKMTGYVHPSRSGILNGNGTNNITQPSTIRVGAGSLYKMPSEAAAVAKDGDIIEILAGTYPGDVAVWHQNNLTIKALHGRAHVKANGKNAEGKAIWVIKGNNTTIENMEFSGAQVPDKNGAGIRQEGTGLVLRNCYFHDNEMGILTSNNQQCDILIEYCEFANNRVEGNFSDHGSIGHNIYIGQAGSLTLRYSYVHHATTGHNVKSRALQNFILYNRIMDEKTGESSYAIDLPNGGTTYLIGNLIQQGPKTDNYHIVSYGAEGMNNPKSELYVVNNTFVNDNDDGVFIRVSQGAEPAKLINNIFAGPGAVLNGLGEKRTNLVAQKGFLNFLSEPPGFVNPAEFDYRLLSDSPAVDKGSDPGSANGISLRPNAQYVHPAKSEKRPIGGYIDIGAYEYSREKK